MSFYGSKLEVATDVSALTGLSLGRLPWSANDRRIATENTTAHNSGEGEIGTVSTVDGGTSLEDDCEIPLPTGEDDVFDWDPMSLG